MDCRRKQRRQIFNENEQTTSIFGFYGCSQANLHINKYFFEKKFPGLAKSVLILHQVVFVFICLG
jgi:hypothetical protein